MEASAGHQVVQSRGTVSTPALVSEGQQTGETACPEINCSSYV